MKAAIRFIIKVSTAPVKWGSSKSCKLDYMSGYGLLNPCEIGNAFTDSDAKSRNDCDKGRTELSGRLAAQVSLISTRSRESSDSHSP